MKSNEEKAHQSISSEELRVPEDGLLLDGRHIPCVNNMTYLKIMPITVAVRAEV
jgi:hypothetical protein